MLISAERINEKQLTIDANNLLFKIDLCFGKFEILISNWNFR